ncbi:MAG TPA: glycosyl hydrolase-related protein, partial [Ktedonobacterales bacterium]|nr:glycosyl hydrolase-related protein [Ktedonobacterales bacterium]
FVYVTPATAVVSAVKRADRDAALIVRLYNPLDTAITAEAILALPFDDVAVVDLTEEHVREAETSNLARILSTGVRTQLRAGEIQTLRFRMAAVML